MDFRIRPAVPDDAPAILRLIRGLAEYERAPDAVVATEADLRAQLASPRPPFECLLAEEGGPADPDPEVGFALFFHNYSTWRGRAGIYLEDLFVAPRARGQGIGRALLARVAAIAVARGCPRLDWAVLDWNRPAIDFYLALGAEALAEWRLYRLSGAPLASLAAEGEPCRSS